MKVTRAACAAVAVAWALTACVRTTGGMPVADGPPPGTSPPPTTSSTPVPGPGEFGVIPTTGPPVPAGTVCAAPTTPPVGVMASVDDPTAPQVTVALPTGWSTTEGQGDVAARLSGPEGVSATVSIARTQLDPAAAFDKYVDDAMAASSVSSISILPAELCGFSGQKLLGSWSPSPQQTVAFGDRIAHVRTETGDYLVAVHVEGPAQAPGFDPFTSPLMDDFAIQIP